MVRTARCSLLRYWARTGRPSRADERLVGSTVDTHWVADMSTPLRHHRLLHSVNRHALLRVDELHLIFL